MTTEHAGNLYQAFVNCQAYQITPELFLPSYRTWICRTVSTTDDPRLSVKITRILSYKFSNLNLKHRISQSSHHP